MMTTPRRSLLALLALALLGAVALSPSPAPARGQAAPSQDICAAPRLLTPTGAPVPRTGFGLVVADSRPDAQLAIALLRGRARTGLAPTPLGPGLFRISAVVRPGIYRLDGVIAPSELTVSMRARPPAPAVAPAVRAARRVARTVMGSEQTRPEILVDLSFPVPPGAILVRAQWNGSPDIGVWASVAAGQNSVTIQSETRCLPPGWQPAPDGPLTMTLSYVDLLGQTSPVSASVNVE